MADFSKTLSNSINLFGASPPTVWGNATVRVMTWGTTNWGDGTHAMIRDIDRGAYSESIVIDGATLLFENEKAWGEILANAFETSHEGIQTLNGYSLIFVKPTAEAEERNLSTYTSHTAGSQTYTSLSVSATTWS